MSKRRAKRASKMVGARGEARESAEREAQRSARKAAGEPQAQQGGKSSRKRGRGQAKPEAVQNAPYYMGHNPTYRPTPKDPISDGCLTFGKYSDIPLEDVPKGYLLWLMDATEDDDLFGAVSDELDRRLEAKGEVFMPGWGWPMTSAAAKEMRGEE